MRCRKPNTDQKAELSAYANGEICAEYAPPTSKSSEPDNVECYIAVKAGDRVTLKGSFSGSVLQGSFDLVVDGSFVGDSRMEGSHGQVKYSRNRRLDFKKVLHCPVPEGWTSIENPKDLFEGSLVVKQFSDDGQKSQGSQTLSRDDKFQGVGSIVVVFSLNQRADETYKQSYRDITVGKWRDILTSSAKGNPDCPELIMDIDISESQEKVSGKRSAKHRRNQFIERFGRQPWARFIFNYRTLTAINNLGCVPLIDYVKDLTPEIPGSFIYSEDLAGQSIKPRQQDDYVKIEEDSQTSSSDSRLFVSPDVTESYGHCAADTNRNQPSARIEDSLFPTLLDSPSYLFQEQQQQMDDGVFTTLGYANAPQASILPYDDPEFAEFAECANETDIKPEELDGPDTFFEYHVEPFSPIDTSQALHPLPTTSSSDHGLASEHTFGLPPTPQDQPRTKSDVMSLPSMEEIKLLFEFHGAEGVIGSALYDLFKKHGPYKDEIWAQEEFQHRYTEIAHMEPHLKRWYVGKGQSGPVSGARDHQAIRRSRQTTVTASVEGRASRKGSSAKAASTTIGRDRDTLLSSLGKSGSLAVGKSHWLSASLQSPIAVEARTTCSSPQKRVAESILIPQAPSKCPRTQIEEEMVEAEEKLQEKLALQSTLRARIQQHDERHREEVRLKREETAKQMEKLRRKLAEADSILDDLAREERMKEKGEWIWEDDRESVGSRPDAAD